MNHLNIVIAICTFIKENGIDIFVLVNSKRSLLEDYDIAINHTKNVQHN